MRAGEAAAATLAFVAARSAGQTPPPPPTTPCACTPEFPFCWKDGCAGSSCWDNYCYKSEMSDNKSSTVCPGRCTSSYLFPTPVPGAIPPHATPPPGEVAPPCDVTKPADDVCADFCSYRCGFYNASRGETGRPRNVTVIRITPKNVTGPADKNTADAPGDVSFVLEKKNITQQCLHYPGSMGCHTDVESHDLYGTFVLEVDGQWGPYQMCNPADGWDTADWKCGLQCGEPTHDGCEEEYGKQNGTSRFGGMQCWCPRTYVSVGRGAPPTSSSSGGAPPSWPPQCANGGYYPAQGRNSSFCYVGEVLATMSGWDFASAATMACKECSGNADCTGWAVGRSGPNSVELFRGHLNSTQCSASAAYSAGKSHSHHHGSSWFGIGLGGTWYSHTSVGECPPGAPLGTNGCSWRLAETLHYKNSTCVDQYADAAVAAYGKPCFDQCPHPLDRNTDCYLDCYRNTLLGDASLNITKPPASLIVDPWLAALTRPEEEGGCPPVTPGPIGGFGPGEVMVV